MTLQYSLIYYDKFSTFRTYTRIHEFLEVYNYHTINVSIETVNDPRKSFGIGKVFRI